jgi:hypothetical protein
MIGDDPDIEDLAGAVILRGVEVSNDSDARLGSAAGVMVAVGPRGELALVGTSWASARALWPRLARAGFERALFVPGGDRLLAVEPDQRPMAVRIFSETRPVAPRVWGRIHQEAQRRIDEQGLTRQYVNIRDYVARDQETGNRDR